MSERGREGGERLGGGGCGREKEGRVKERKGGGEGYRRRRG